MTTIASHTTTALARPALRLHLLELFLGNTDMPDQALPLAQAAEAWITGDELAGQEAAMGTAGDSQTDVVSLRPVEVRGKRQPSTRRAEILALMEEGLTAREIADKVGVTPSSITARATQWRVTEMWREARKRRASQSATAATVPATEPEIVPSASDTTEAPEAVELPPPDEQQQPAENLSTDDHIAAALVMDKPTAARDVRPGDTWAFTGHRTLAEVEVTAEPPRHTAAPLVPPAPEETTRAPRRFAGAGTKLATHLPGDVVAEKRAERDLIEQALERGMVKIKRVVTAAHHPGGRVPLDTVITYLRNDDVVVSINKGQWLVNGMDTLSAKQLLERANKRRKRHRLAPFELER